MNQIRGLRYVWRLPSAGYDRSVCAEIASLYNFSLPLIEVLMNRGLTESSTIKEFLFGGYEKEVGSAGLLKDAEKAVTRIIEAIRAQEKILIAGDYDVDGVTSSALMMMCLVPLGAQVNFFLPHRVRDGYGLSIKTIQRAAKNNYKVIITVDNGISAFDQAQEARRLGIDLIITDHHRPHDVVPEAFAVIDPHQQDCPYPYKFFAGVGISFKVMSLLYERLGMQLPMQVYELLLLGTVADVVPLTGENRFWVRHGLRYITSTASYALSVLRDNARITKPALSSTDIGFFITPQINALGRLEDAREAVKFLIGSDVNETKRIGTILKSLNEVRKNTEQSILASIEADIFTNKIDVSTERIIMAFSHQWPPGVIGLVASRLVSKFNRPALLFHITDQGIAKGSCRSIPEFDMFNALSYCKDLLESFGGHSVAAGLSIKKERLSELKQRLEQLIEKQLTWEDLQHKLSVDAELRLQEVTRKITADMAYLEPFGAGNPVPVLYIKNVMIYQKIVLLKDLHVKCSIMSEGIVRSVIFFNRPDVYKYLMVHKDQEFDIAVQVTENHWNGEVTVELQGIDIAMKT
jgi:single-stranded-DNA-specific exonuclease